MPETRQLAPIMFTNIVGYSALMGKDKTAAYQLLKQNKYFQKPLIEKHGCEWLTEMGEKEHVFEWLEKSCQDHEVDKFCLKVEHPFEPLRDDPRCMEMLANVGFPE